MPNNREVVTLHFGQAGIQIGNAIWETMIMEHGIQCNGIKDLQNNLSINYENAVNSLFHLAPSGQYIPRSLIVDTEASVVDEIRSGYYRNLFHPDLLVSGIEDSANNFARGYYSLGKKMLTDLLEKVRYIIESCNNFKGFLSYTGSGGGTGTGLYSLFIERIMLEYSGKFCIASLILPGSKLSDSIVEPYNTILRIGQSAVSTDLNIMLDNESLYKICSDKLDTYKPTYNNINRLLAPIFSTITAPFRFEGPMIGDLTEMATNLVPYPKINFPSLSYSPFMSTQKSDHTLLTSQSLTSDVFNFDHSLLSLDIKKYKIMSSFLVYRGNHQKCSIIKVLDSLKKDEVFHWVDWCPTGFKVAQSIFPPIQNFHTQPEKSVMMLCNHSGIIHHFDQIILKFQRLFKKKCFVHWFIGEGMEFDELSNAHNIMSQLRFTYEDVCQIEKLAIDKSNSVEKEICNRITSKDSGLVADQISVSESEEPKKAGEVLIEKTYAEPIKTSLMYKRIDMDAVTNRTNKTISADTNNAKLNEETVANTSVIEALPDNPKKPSEYILSDKAKEVLLENLTTLSPELKQRMLGFTNID